MQRIRTRDCTLLSLLLIVRFLPFGVGCLCVRDGTVLKKTFAESLNATYLKQNPSDIVNDMSKLENFDFVDMSMETSRPYRAVQIWLPLQLHGMTEYVTTIQGRMDLTMLFAKELQSKASDMFELVQPPILPCVLFRAKPLSHHAKLSSEQMAILVLEKVNAYQQVFMYSSKWQGELLLRITTQSCYITAETVCTCVRDLIQAYQEVTETL